MHDRITEEVDPLLRPHRRLDPETSRRSIELERCVLALLDEVLNALPAQRESLVTEAREHHPRAAEEVVHLMAGEDRLAGFLEPAEQEATAPIVPSRMAPPSETSVTQESGPEQGSGERFGPFQILRPLGEGGMGQVFLARQLEPVRRIVALKIMLPSLTSAEAQTRFQAERHALARLNHANVARHYDSGTAKDGRLYLAMEYVAGRAITTVCDERRLDLESRLRLFVQVCHGVHHAHQKQLVHRDLKPSNVLIDEHTEPPTPKVIDFGVAKALDGPIMDATMLTGDWLPGSPAYASPETLGGAGLEPDTRSDVYSLGVLLFELLTGTRPFEEGEPSVFELVQRVREHEPRRPSARLGALDDQEIDTIADRRSTHAQALRSRLSGDLDWIVLRALDKDRSRRYESAAALGRDVERHLEHEPIEARPAGGLYRFGKLLRRHRLASALSCALIVALLGGLTASVLLLARAQNAERVAVYAARRADHIAGLEVRSRREAETVTAFLADLLRAPSPQASTALTTQELLERGMRRLRDQPVDQPLPRAHLEATLGRIFLDLGLGQHAGPLFASALARREAELGAWDLEVAASLDDLATWHLAQGRVTEAAELHRRSIAIAEVHGEAGADHLSKARQGLAAVLAEKVTQIDLP